MATTHLRRWTGLVHPHEHHDAGGRGEGGDGPDGGVDRHDVGEDAGKEGADGEAAVVRVFLIGDAVSCAMADQKVDGCYHLDRMILSAARHGAEVGCCGTCMDARGISDDHLTKGAHRSTLEELTDWTLWADKTVTF